MFTDLKPYPKYADSGITWLGQLPAHWHVNRLGQIGTFLKGSGGSREDDVAAGVPCVRYGDVYKYHNTFVLRAQSFVSEEQSEGYTHLRRGDLLFALSGESQAEIGKSAVNLIFGRAVCGGDLAIFRANAPIDSRFLGYVTDAYPSVVQKSRMGRGDIVVHVSAGRLKRLCVGLPPIDEQVAIVKYLGHANARIDRAIAAKRKLIALLEEQKRAIINQAVTRGLDTDAPLKDSGIPWLGLVPAHWQAIALRRAWEVIDCKHLTVPYLDDGYPLASVVQAQRFFLDLSDARRTGRDHYSSLIEGARRPQKGDLVYCRNVGVGSAAVVTGDETFAMGQDVCLLRSAVQDSIFMNHFLRSRPMSIQLDRLLVGSTFRRINISQIRALVILVPPLTEQHEIVRQIESETEGLDAVTRRSTREIELLREFRTRLTADVVTGQLDIRDAAARLPELDLSDLVSDVGPDEGELDEVLAASLDEVGA